VEFRVLGPVQVWADGCQVAVGGSLQRVLLAGLLLRANRVVAAERLIDLLWGPSRPKTARAGLQSRVSQLRRALARLDGDDGPVPAGADRVLFRPPGYELRVAPGEVDLEEFRRLAEEGRQALAVGDPARASESLAAALGLWRGRPFEDAGATGLAREADWLEDRRLGVLEDRVEADLRLGRHAELATELTAHVAVHPLRERLRGQQMLALSRSGRPADALASYRDARAALRDALGIDPSPHLQQLQLAILARDPALDPPPARRNGRPDAAAAPAGPGPRRTPVPAQLPCDVADFIGRGDELGTLLSRLRRRHPTATPVAVVSGVAGVGKSALAVHAAHQLRQHFPDGQLFVDLHGVDRTPPRAPAGALLDCLHSLGVADGDLPPSLDARAGLYRTCLDGKRVLLVLDNAASEAQVRPLLPGGSGCAVLVTSRTGLPGLAGPLALELPPLPPDDALALLVSIVGSARVDLEPAAAALIVRLCGYLPASIRIAGAKVAMHPRRRLAWLAELLASEQSRLDELLVEELEVGADLARGHEALHQVRERMLRLAGLLRPQDWAAWVAAVLLNADLDDAKHLLDRMVLGAESLANGANGGGAVDQGAEVFGFARAQVGEQPQ